MTLLTSKTRVRYNLELLISVCNSNNIELIKDYGDKNINRDTRIQGKCITNTCLNEFDKTFRNLYHTKGYCKKCMENIRNEKCKTTCLKRYGVEYTLQSEEVKEKGKATCLERYGVEYSLQSEEVKEKGKATNLKNLGVENPSQSEEVKEKKKATCFKNLGVEHSFQSEEVREKSKATSLKRYGVEHPMHNAEVMEKASKNAYNLKDYIYPSGAIIKVQGYEPHALDELLREGQTEDNIVVKRTHVPEVWYDDDEGKRHRYYVDIFIPSQNRCIEVKSTWTLEKKKHIVFIKQQAVKNAGYKCEIWIYNAKEERVKCYN